MCVFSDIICFLWIFVYFIHRLYKYIREVLGKVSAAIKNLEYNGSAKEKNVQDD